MKKLIALLGIIALAGVSFGQTIGIVNLRAPTSTVLTAESIPANPGDIIHIPINDIGEPEMRWFDGSITGGYTFAQASTYKRIEVHPGSNPTNNAALVIEAIADAVTMSPTSADNVYIILGNGAYEFEAANVTVPDYIRLRSEEVVTRYLGRISDIWMGQYEMLLLPSVKFTSTGLFSLGSGTAYGIHFAMPSTADSGQFERCIFIDTVGASLSSGENLFFNECRFLNPLFETIGNSLLKMTFNSCSFSTATAGSFTQAVTGDGSFNAAFKDCFIAGDSWFVGVEGAFSSSLSGAEFQSCFFHEVDTWGATKCYFDFSRCDGLDASQIAHASTTIRASYNEAKTAIVDQ